MTLTISKPDEDVATQEDATNEAPQTPIDGSAATTEASADNNAAESGGDTKATNADEATEPTAVCPIDAAEIFKLQDRINEAASREHAAKENYSIAKKNRESAQAALSEYIEEMRQPGLFKQPATRPQDTMTASVAKPESADPEPWRKTTLAELEIPEQIVDKLLDHNPSLSTLGAIADFTLAGNNLTDVKGIGEAKAAKIEDCLNEFWRTYEGPRGDVEAAIEPEDGEEDEGNEGDDSDDTDTDSQD